MTLLLSVADLNTTASPEPRVAYQRIAEVLGAAPHGIRQLVERNQTELERYGKVLHAACKTTKSGGRPGKTYYLNEAQALLVCIRSDAPRAPDARQAIIEVFIEYRRNKLIPAIECTTVRQHNRRISTGRETALRLAALVERLEKLESALTPELKLPAAPAAKPAPATVHPPRVPTPWAPTRAQSESVERALRLAAEAAFGAACTPNKHLHPLISLGHCLDAAAAAERSASK